MSLPRWRKGLSTGAAESYLGGDQIPGHYTVIANNVSFLIS